MTGPDTPGELFVEGPRYNVHRVYGLTQQQQRDLARGLPPRLFTPDVPLGSVVPAAFSWGTAGGVNQQLAAGTPSGLIQTMETAAAKRDAQIVAGLARVQNAVAVSQQQLAADVATIESYNAGVAQTNETAVSALRELSGEDRGDSSVAWQAWWTDQQGYASDTSTAPKPTFSQFVSNPSVPIHHSCFAAGTPVRTINGLVPIESIKTGDRVLTQDPETGRLSFQPVVGVYHNRPNATLKVDLGGEAVVATGIHRFWKAGKGWVMARELKTGDVVRTLGGTARVGSVETGEVQRVYNLEVASGQSFFVGAAGVLVHDNSLVRPVELPFDTVASSATPGSAAE
jgi:hypothetical protein